jgi:hypothetical protein
MSGHSGRDGHTGRDDRAQLARQFRRALIPVQVEPQRVLYVIGRWTAVTEGRRRVAAGIGRQSVDILWSQTGIGYSSPARLQRQIQRGSAEPTAHR